ncbi:uncharacterized protein G2W53_008099 [Senna tora]|uniref:Uncharacterized protein n=1 Tax=Senna tora TaxID=362788 RepID=A0A834X7S3_9FABA|nr:uncharacterized protein G2W53_008099 [Senna tora]
MKLPKCVFYKTSTMTMFTPRSPFFSPLQERDLMPAPSLCARIRFLTMETALQLAPLDCFDVRQAINTVWMA